MNLGHIKPCAHRHAHHRVITILCLGLSLRSETFPWRAPCWQEGVVRESFFFLAPKAPKEEVRVQKRKGHLTVLSGDKSDGHMSDYCLVVVYSCTYSPDKFHCLWYKTPSGIGNLKEKQESILVNASHPGLGLKYTGVGKTSFSSHAESTPAPAKLEKSGAVLGLSLYIRMMPPHSMSPLEGQERQNSSV